MHKRLCFCTESENDYFHPQGFCYYNKLMLCIFTQELRNEIEEIKIEIIANIEKCLNLKGNYKFTCSEDEKTYCVKTKTREYIILSYLKAKRISFTEAAKCSIYYFESHQDMELFIHSDFKSKTEDQNIFNYFPSKTEAELIAFCDCMEDEDSDYFWELLQIEKKYQKIEDHTMTKEEIYMENFFKIIDSIIADKRKEPSMFARFFYYTENPS